MCIVIVQFRVSSAMDFKTLKLIGLSLYRGADPRGEGAVTIFSHGDVRMEGQTLTMDPVKIFQPKIFSSCMESQFFG